MSVGCGILGFQTKAEVSSSMGYDARGWFCASLTETWNHPLVYQQLRFIYTHLYSFFFFFLNESPAVMRVAPVPINSPIGMPPVCGRVGASYGTS